jgi:hypothetical protein
MKRAFLKGWIGAGKARLFLVIRTRDDQKAHEQRAKKHAGYQSNCCDHDGLLKFEWLKPKVTFCAASVLLLEAP